MPPKESDHPRIDWRQERDRVDLARVTTELLGEAPGRRGERGRRSWWNCPFHGDANPSFYVEPGKPWWKCLGCGEHGDAASLVMRLEGLTFPEAIARLTGETFAPTSYRPPPRPLPPPTPTGPRGLPIAEALALVVDAEARLWSDAGAEARAYLTRDRHLDEATIRAARLGWTPGVELPTQDGKRFTARGTVVPWFDNDRLALVKLRQPGDARPKYAEAFRDRPGVLMGSTGSSSLPLVIVEGEFDAILVGQELRDLAVVVTIGPASVRPDASVLARFVGHSRWYTATDNDEAGDRSADSWSKSARRVRPPGPHNDWTEASQGGVDLRRWWTDRLAGIESPELFTWSELSAWRWGDAAVVAADQADEGIDVLADSWRWELAGWPADRWTAWHRRADELTPPGADPKTVRAAQREAYEEFRREVVGSVA